MNIKDCAIVSCKYLQLLALKLIRIILSWNKTTVSHNIRDHSCEILKCLTSFINLIVTE